MIKYMDVPLDLISSLNNNLLKEGTNRDANQNVPRY
jgi:hypothetical protein